jgi:hypothetical protein
MFSGSMQLGTCTSGLSMLEASSGMPSLSDTNEIALFQVLQ